MKRRLNLIRVHARYVLVYFLAVAGFVVAAGIFFADEPWSPLGPYETQTIDNVNLERATVTVTGTKCTSEALTVVGTVSWIAIDPPGAIVTVGSSSTPRPEGCETRTFTNPIPAEVLRLDARSPSLWQILGAETPLSDDREGATAVWRTEPFLLVNT
jgi:hypothetical protein